MTFKIFKIFNWVLRRETTRPFSLGNRSSNDLWILISQTGSCCDFVNQLLKWRFCLCLSCYRAEKSSEEPLISLSERSSTTVCDQTMFVLPFSVLICKSNVWLLSVGFINSIHCGSAEYVTWQLSCSWRIESDLRRRLWIWCIDTGAAVQRDFNTPAIEGWSV